MKCTHPLTILKENGAQFQVPCGRCMSCRLNRNNMWSVRIVSEAKSWKYSSFLTLTYDDEHLPISPLGHPTLCKRDAQLFFKSLRKEIKCRYFLGAEYGGIFRRPHFHACLFSDDSKITERNFIQEHWQRGFVGIGKLTLASARYIAKYCCSKLGGKSAFEHYTSKQIEPEFALMSRRPGIGFDYLEKYKDLLKSRGYVIVDGKKQPLPRYFASKLYTDDEKSDRFNERSLQSYTDLIDLADKNDVPLYKALLYKKQEDKQRDLNLKSRLNLRKK